MPVDRDAIVSNAKYLRNVRPVDPTEIREYVEGQPDARVVRQVLREEAVSLGVIEDDDGLFRPVSDGSVEPVFSEVEALPDRYVEIVETLLAEEYGPEWATGETGEHLREIIRRFKSDYYRQHQVEYDRDVALGYAIYHLATYYASAQYVLWDLARDGLLNRSLRVLDVGAGVGGPALGLHDLVTSDGSEPALVEYHALEPSDAVSVLEPLLDTTDRNFHPTVHRERAETFEPTGEYDLVLFSNVLNELDDPSAVASKYLEFLADDGTLVAVAPADKNTSLLLRSVERDLEDGGATVYGPTVRLWPGERPTTDLWSFDERRGIEAPPYQQRLAQGAERPSEFLHTSVKFSYSMLRTDGRRRYDIDANQAAVTKLAESERHVTDRVDLLVAKLSRNLSEGDNLLYTVSDGSEQVPHFAVVVKETALNRPLVDASYGDILSLEQALLLWNDDEEAYNVVVDEETIVDAG